MANNCIDKETVVRMDESNSMITKADSSQSATQPLILGNINAANLLTTNVTGTQNSVFVPTNLMTLPTCVNNDNQVIGIVPLILQGSQMQGNLDSSSVIHLNSDLSISCGIGDGSDVAGNIPSQPIYYSSSIPQQCTLASSDTLILSTSASKLASADTIPLLSSGSDGSKNKYPIMTEQLQSKESSMQSTFSLVSNLSNRSVDLENIPTVTLFKPDACENIVVSVDNNQRNVSKPISSHCSDSPHDLKNIDLSSVGYQTRSKSKRKRNNESKSKPLHIDDDTDTEADDVFSHVVESTVKMENSLTRGDTVILPTTAESIAPPPNDSSLTESDTLIISNDCSKRDLCNNAVPTTDIASVGISVEICNSNDVIDIDKVLSVSGGHIITQPSLPSMSSIPSLVLTESMVEGTVNPTLICDLLSQSSENPVRIQSLKSMSADQIASSENVSLISSLQNSFQPTSLAVSSQSSIQIQGVPLNVSLQNFSQGTSSSIALNTSVKGTQTDWLLGNMPVPVTLVPNTNISQTTGSTEQQPVEELPFPCVNCEQKFPSKLELKKHEKEAHKKVLKCDLCSSTFTRLGNYTRHKKIHELKPDQKRHTCAECGREFLQRCDLKRHLLIHSNQQPHRCKICDKGYIRHSDLVVHMRFHYKEKNFQCNLCDKKYFQSGDLSRHIRRVHKPTTQLTCGHCERKYACEVTLIRHMKLVHKDIILKTAIKGEVEENS